ncbi:ATP-binding protein [Streptomonospora sp. NEAU-YY374]|nr:ATP-binding protein [Streptomonospora nanhaiensis]
MQPHRPTPANPPPNTLCRILATSDPSQVGAVRAWIAEATVEEARSHDIQLVAGELVANALTHSSFPAPPGPIGMIALRQSAHHVEVRVTNHAPRPGSVPLPRPADPDAESGRGLLLVAALADIWGWHREDTRITVWARFHRCGGAQWWACAVGAARPCALRATPASPPPSNPAHRPLPNRCSTPPPAPAPWRKPFERAADSGSTVWPIPASRWSPSRRPPCGVAAACWSGATLWAGVCRSSPRRSTTP